MPNIYLSSNGLTDLSDRPNILICDNRQNKDRQIQNLLIRDEMNVADTNQPVYAADGAHLLIIRDGGMERPAFDTLEKLRSFSDIPVMMIPDNISEMYTIMALSKGADACMEWGADYEFRARVTALLRRRLYAPAAPQRLSNGVISIDRRTRKVYAEGSHIRMTAIEYGILEYLLANLGDACSIDDIYRSVWHEQPYKVRKTIVEHIRRIRAKIEPDPHNPSYIKAVSGIGYKMEYAY
ncbi:MAG: response regulator transcription factor [Oscillospiraceae bacterium]|nr:response regulator transcription factor [Oscillospiraceae bacterium]